MEICLCCVLDNVDSNNNTSCTTAAAATVTSESSVANEGASTSPELLSTAVAGHATSNHKQVFRG